MTEKNSLRQRKKEKVNAKVPAKQTKGSKDSSLNKYAAVSLTLMICFGVAYKFLGDHDNLVARPYLPFIYPDCCTANEDQLTRLWGSYRPQVYFGMRTRLPESIIFGLMWMPMRNEFTGEFRHTAEQNELKSFMWTKHDGTNFGMQVLKDNGYDLETSFVKTNYALQDWTARIKVMSTGSRQTPKVVSLFWYVGVEHSQSNLRLSAIDNGYAVQGETPELGKFQFSYKTRAENPDVRYSSVLCGRNVPLHHLSDFVKQNLKPVTSRFGYTLVGLDGDIGACSESSNVFVLQLVVPINSAIEVVYENLNIRRSQTLEGSLYDEALSKHIQAFDEKFEKKFQLHNKGFTDKRADFAKAAFSNLIGGIGYFHGKSIVTSSKREKPVYYFPASLYTAVPSRSFFPRGFLWDEGFHQLVISKWDKTISFEVIGHWLNLMNADGWIPREQILGNEALMRVPQEFVVQNADFANPPTMFLPIESMLNSMEPDDILEHHSTLKKMYHRLSLWFSWYNTTQLGQEHTTYRWRGRNETTDHELNPKTLTSGLDDYPRASHPSKEEYHVDLRCWVALAARSLTTLGEVVGVPVDAFRATASMLSDNKMLSKLHWTGSYFADYGLHSDNVGLRTMRFGDSVTKRRVVKKLPKLQFVPVQGYINLFPFLLNILEHDSKELGIILNNLKNTSNLWSNFGLCSVGKSDSYYLKYNTEHDAPYWRGPIWININYLAIRSLYYYSNIPGPYRDISRTLYSELRSNVITNMYTEYMRTGYIWEQYNCDTGKGQSVHPFTGWSSLVTLIMGELY